MRDLYKQHSPELSEWIDELLPWHLKDLTEPLVTILDDDDLKQSGLYSAQTLDE